MRENFVSPSNFILPIFVHEEGDKNVPIASMPGVYRLAYGNNVISAVAEARAYGVNQVVIFPKVRGQGQGGAGAGRRPGAACTQDKQGPDDRQLQIPLSARLGRG
jgi:delta-aminolevulinic acid dehydratase/porphobilinogen synthase